MVLAEVEGALLLVLLLSNSIFIQDSYLSSIHSLERSSGDGCPQWGGGLRLEIEKLLLKYCHFYSVVDFPKALQPDMEVFGSGSHNPYP